MTPRPPTHREPTDEEMQCLPEGTLEICQFSFEWVNSDAVGKSVFEYAHKSNYAVPVTKQQEVPTLQSAFDLLEEVKQFLEFLPSEYIHKESLCPIGYSPDGTLAKITAMLAARNNQPEKV